jgi:hypothetical protein
VLTKKVKMCSTIFVVLVLLGGLLNNYVTRERQSHMPPLPSPSNSLTEDISTKSFDTPDMPFKPREYIRIRRTKLSDF